MKIKKNNLSKSILISFCLLFVVVSSLFISGFSFNNKLKVYADTWSGVVVSSGTTNSSTSGCNLSLPTADWTYCVLGYDADWSRLVVYKKDLVNGSVLGYTHIKNEGAIINAYEITYREMINNNGVVIDKYFSCLNKSGFSLSLKYSFYYLNEEIPSYNIKFVSNINSLSRNITCYAGKNIDESFSAWNIENYKLKGFSLDLINLLDSSYTFDSDKTIYVIYECDIDKIKNSVDITTDNEKAIEDFISDNSYHSDEDYNKYGEDKYNLGFNAGVKKAENDKSFGELMFSIIDAPFNVLKNAFDFEILGYNVSNLLTAVVSLILVGFVVKLFI